MIWVNKTQWSPCQLLEIALQDSYWISSRCFIKPFTSWQMNRNAKGINLSANVSSKVFKWRILALRTHANTDFVAWGYQNYFSRNWDISCTVFFPKIGCSGHQELAVVRLSNFEGRKSDLALRAWHVMQKRLTEVNEYSTRLAISNITFTSERRSRF